MIRFIPYECSHLRKIRLRPEYEGTSSVLALPTGEVMAQRFADQGNALTIADHADNILAICIWIALAPGIIDVGMFASDDIYVQPRAYVRFARREFKEFLRTLVGGSVRRIQTMSFPDAIHDRWMRWLGFECEGTLKKYAHNGADMRMWAITEV